MSIPPKVYGQAGEVGQKEHGKDHPCDSHVPGLLSHGRDPGLNVTVQRLNILFLILPRNEWDVFKLLSGIKREQEEFKKMKDVAPA